MPKSAPGPRVVRLVRLRKGPLGAVFGLLFVLAAALPIAYGCLLGWSLSRAEGLADPAAWTVLIGAYLVAAGGGLVLHFVLYPDVELYTHGVQIRLPGRRVRLPWTAIAQARETRGPTLLLLETPLTPLHRALALLTPRRTHAQAVILLSRSQRHYPQARAILQEYLPAERFIAS